MLEWLSLLMEHWPTVGLIVTLLIGVFLVARYLRGAEVRDMRDRVDYLDGQVRALRYRDQCYFEYTLYIEECHRRAMLLAASKGCTFERHMSFLEFRDRWMLERGLQDEQEEIWQT